MQLGILNTDELHYERPCLLGLYLHGSLHAQKNKEATQQCSKAEWVQVVRTESQTQANNSNTLLYYSATSCKGAVRG